MQMAKVWAISTNKGGVLKTSTTVNLAGVLSERYKVLVIDADNQGNVALSFGKNPDTLENTIYDVLVDGLDVKQAILPVYPNINILPSNDDMAFFEFDVLQHQEKYSQPYGLLKAAVSSVRDEYDFILIDSPPNLGLVTGNVLTSADGVLIPFQPENYSMRSLQKIIKAVREFRDTYNPTLEILGILGTLVDTRTTLHSVVLQECRKFCEREGLRMFETTIPRSIRFANSVAFEGMPATLTDSKDKIVQNYYELSRELI